ncbi:hypothetical protein Poli38472_004368 [Pythium oligandrum]|uniref:Protein kinase domain-containing protein n=1 Tax=Pythium oligandrum TaxID=41045 RepID=A0A8K1CA59_PYTOL|nr:hypothetical protein Poli38472_004368 [Pythium oligandrum]|eukprot:TMW59299.1 hypothetical protein Poli38472_004368 [Pythium oligandrum]
MAEGTTTSERHEDEEQMLVDTQASMYALTTTLVELSGVANAEDLESSLTPETSHESRYVMEDDAMPAGRLPVAANTAFHDVEPAFESIASAGQTFQLLRDAISTHTICYKCYSDWTIEALGLIVAEEVVFSVVFTRTVVNSRVRVAFHLLEGDSMHFLHITHSIQSQCVAIDKRFEDVPDEMRVNVLSKWTARNESNEMSSLPEDLLLDLLFDASSDRLHTQVYENAVQQLKDACVGKANREILRTSMSDKLLGALCKVLASSNETIVRFGLFIVLQFAQAENSWVGLEDSLLLDQIHSHSSSEAISTRYIRTQVQTLLLEGKEPVEPEDLDAFSSLSGETMMQEPLSPAFSYSAPLSAMALKNLEESSLRAPLESTTATSLSTSVQDSDNRQRSGRGSISRAFTRVRDVFTSAFSRRKPLSSLPESAVYRHDSSADSRASSAGSEGSQSGKWKDTVSEAGTYSSEMTASTMFSRQSAGDAGVIQSFLADPVIALARIPTTDVETVNTLGRGSSGEVLLGRYEDRLVAVKRLLPEYKRETKRIKIFCDEIRLMTRLEHPEITAFVGVSWDTLQNLSVIAEYMEGGALNHLLYETDRPLSWAKEKLPIVTNVIEALMYLHTMQPAVIHRDLWSKNVLLTSKYEAKLNIFNIGRTQNQDNIMTAAFPASVLWMAPEVLIGERHTEKADIYSFGVLLSELDTRQIPLSSLRDDRGQQLQPFRIINMLISGQLKIDLSPDCPPELLKLAHQCMSKDPNDRPTSTEVAYALHSRVAPSVGKQMSWAEIASVDFN